MSFRYRQRPMSPSQELIERRRHEIARAASTAFASKGYHATGVADIATELGIGHGTFYRYFENKRDILDFVIGEVLARIGGALASEDPSAAASIEEYRQQAERIGGALFDVFIEDPELAQLFFVEAVGVDRESAEKVFGAQELMAATGAQYLTERDRPRLPPRRPRRDDDRARDQRDDLRLHDGGDAGARSRCGPRPLGRGDRARDVRRDPAAMTHVRCLIVGAGFSGIGMAVALRDEGMDDFLVIEKASAPGGTWRENTYPGCACDVPSAISYSFSYEPNPDWSHVYAHQPEIEADLKPDGRAPRARRLDQLRHRSRRAPNGTSPTPSGGSRRTRVRTPPTH